MKEKAFELIKRFLFPKFSNRITWFVLIIGSGLFGTSIIENIVASFIEKEYKISLIDSSDNLYGLLCILLGLAYNAIILFIEKKPNINKSISIYENLEKITIHDIEKFNLYEQIINENSLEIILDDVAGAHYIKSEDISKIVKFNIEGSKKSNEFITKSLSVKFDILKKTFNELEKFISENFFSNHNPQYRVSYLFPEGNIERCRYGFEPEDEKKYKKLSSDLNDLVFRIEEKYKIYRQAIKEELKI